MHAKNAVCASHHSTQTSFIMHMTDVKAGQAHSIARYETMESQAQNEPRQPKWAPGQEPVKAGFLCEEGACRPTVA